MSDLQIEMVVCCRVLLHVRGDLKWVDVWFKVSKADGSCSERVSCLARLFLAKSADWVYIAPLSIKVCPLGPDTRRCSHKGHVVDTNSSMWVILNLPWANTELLRTLEAIVKTTIFVDELLKGAALGISLAFVIPWICSSLIGREDDCRRTIIIDHTFASVLDCTTTICINSAQVSVP